MRDDVCAFVPRFFRGKCVDTLDEIYYEECEQDFECAQGKLFAKYSDFFNEEDLHHIAEKHGLNFVQTEVPQPSSRPSLDGYVPP